MRRKTILAASLGATALTALALSRDSTLALSREGYDFIPNRSQRYGSDAFETRLLLRKVVCMTGEEASRVFYEPDRFTRRGAMPPTAVKLLQDFGSVQQLDGEAHRRRKQMHMSLMGPESLGRLTDLVSEQWHACIEKWETMDKVILHDEVEGILCRAACEWAGVPLPESEAARRTREIHAMIEGAGSAGPRFLRGLLLRARTERWLRGIIERARSGDPSIPEGSAARVIASHRDTQGRPLTTEAAAVELLNLLRPTVAIARFVTFAALALHEHPESGDRLRDADGDYPELFVQEVRRFYPFFPFTGGRVRSEFDWRGRRFSRGTWAILDLYGTDHDPRIWESPEEFRPERFRRWDGSAFNFIPQGGGDHYTGHRCAGEWITIDVMKRAAHLLTESMTYDVAPDQDLRVDLSKTPALPESRFVISGVRRSR